MPYDTMSDQEIRDSILTEEAEIRSKRQELMDRKVVTDSAVTVSAVEAYRDDLSHLPEYLAAEGVTIDVMPPDPVREDYCILVFPVAAVVDPKMRAIWGGIPILFDESGLVTSATKLENPSVPGLYDRVQCNALDAKTILARTEDHLISSGVITVT